MCAVFNQTFGFLLDLIAFRKAMMALDSAKERGTNGPFSHGCVGRNLCRGCLEVLDGL